ncbi:MAG: T9SS type A sorting domain-containing protein [Bacteroidota bacterium]
MKSFSLTLLAFLSIFFLAGQDKKILKGIQISTTKALLLGSVAPKTDGSYRTTSFEKKLSKKKQKQIPPNFIGRGKSKVIKPELEHQGPDPIRQTRFTRKASTIIEPFVNINGLTQFGSPHDPTGAVGLNHYVQAINVTQIGIYDKSGILEDSFAASSLWTPLGESSLGDPIVLYAHESDQWIITEFSDPALLLIAVSETSDPLGNYHVYSFATPQFPDYPKYAIWDDFLVVTTNETGPEELHQYFFDKDALLSGLSEVAIQRVAINGNIDTEAGFYVSTPVHWNGANLPVNNNPIALKINDSSWGEVENDVVEVISFDVNLDNADSTTVSLTQIEVAPFDSYPCDNEDIGFACLSQGVGAGGLDAIPEVVMNIPHYRNFGTHESIVLNFITDVTDGDNLSGIRWMELRRTSGNDWELHQEGTFAPDDGLHRYMGSIAIDELGNIGLAYTVSGPTTFAGLRFTGRYANDPLGEMTIQEAIIVDGINSIATDRFGDYAHMTVDPIDGQTFWFTSEYGGNGSDNSLTRIVAFQLEKKDNDLAVVDIITPETSGELGASESVVAAIQNVGNLDASSFDLSLSLDSILIETFTYDEILIAGDIYEHTFSTTIDLSAVGDYIIEVSLNYLDDESERNDFRDKKIRKLAMVDAAILLDVEEELCASTTSGSITLTNEGANILTTVEIETYIGDQLQETINWTGNLETGESENLEVSFSGLVEVDNTLTSEILSVNGTLDQVESNNSSDVMVVLNNELEQVSLVLTTDDFPNETSWMLENSDGEVIFSGGPYNNVGTFTENFCLRLDQCYVFVANDSFGDGICCDYGVGSYELLNSEGNIIFSSNGQFNQIEETIVCVGNPPQNDASVEIYEVNETVCTTNFVSQMEIRNLGEQSLTSVDLEVEINGTVTDNFQWTGNLSIAESNYFILNYSGLIEGENIVVARVSNPNGVIDDGIDSNIDTASITVQSDLESENLSLIILLDDSPEETRWELTDESNDIIYSGGPYSGNAGQIIESLCVSKDGCYELMLFDSFENGICCDFGEGNYSLLNTAGETIISSDGNFGGSESNNFCIGNICNLSVEVSKTDVMGDQLGMIMITANGGVSYEYSINGGATFRFSNTFNNLSVGNYEILVRDSLDCTVSASVEILEIPLSTKSLEDELKISPNPSEGLFNITLSGEYSTDHYLIIQVFDINGKLIQERRFGRYDNEFRGEISLYAYPAGMYLLKPSNVRTDKLFRVIKE